jgi:hypothetical protein
VWLPKVGLGLGRERGIYLGRDREWLYWYDDTGQRLSTPEEGIAQESARADRLADKLKELGIDPEAV